MWVVLQKDLTFYLEYQKDENLLILYRFNSIAPKMFIM